MSLTYIFKKGKHKGKQIKWVQKNDYDYIRAINKGNVELGLTQSIKDFIGKREDYKSFSGIK